MRKSTVIVQAEVLLSHLVLVEANEFAPWLSQMTKKILMEMIRNDNAASVSARNKDAILVPLVANFFFTVYLGPLAATLSRLTFIAVGWHV